jgi:RNA polymerase sigma factor (sigma-70 family)
MPEPDLRKDLVVSKLGLVVRAVRRIARRYQGTDLDILDLIQEGNLALVQAVNEWLDHPPRSAHFQAFIAQRVYQALRECADGARRESASLCSLEEHWDELCQVEAPGELEPAERLIHREHQEAIIAMLGSLDRRRRKVVALRFGFYDGRQRTYEEIGQVMGVSRARAAQLMASATRILRHPSRACKLVDVYRDLG